MNYLKFENKIYELILEKLLKKWMKTDFTSNNYEYFQSSEEIKGWGQKDNLYFNNLIDTKNKLRANKDELYELESFDYYQGHVAERMNNLLRGLESYPDNESLKKRISIIEKTISKFELKSNTIVIRRTKSFIFNNINKGEVFNELGFMSTSINLSYRLDIDGNRKFLKNEAILFIKVPKKTRAVYIQEAQEKRKKRKEYELLIQKGSIIKIEKNYKIVTNRIIFGELLPN